MGKLNIYYIKNIEPEDTLNNQLDRIGGAFGNYISHFNALKEFVPGLRCFGLFDSDNLPKQDKREENMAILYWKDYEVENYFITPDVLLKYVTAQFNEDVGPLFINTMPKNAQDFVDVINEVLLETVFNGDTDQLKEYQKASAGLKRTLLRSIKMSQFTEKVFYVYAKKYSQPVLLNKGEFYKLIPFCTVDEIPKEVHEKLDVLVEYLEYPNE
jgi:hypothetical protein